MGRDSGLPQLWPREPQHTDSHLSGHKGSTCMDQSPRNPKDVAVAPRGSRRLCRKPTDLWTFQLLSGLKSCVMWDWWVTFFVSSNWTDCHDAGLAGSHGYEEKGRLYKINNGEAGKRSGAGVTEKQTGSTQARETKGVRAFCVSGLVNTWEKLKIRWINFWTWIRALMKQWSQELSWDLADSTFVCLFVSYFIFAWSLFAGNPNVQL